MTLEAQLGYVFSDPELLRLALTHRSVTADDPERFDNERLEFLGDAVLQLVVTEFLYDRFADLAEGQMAKVRAGVVSRSALSEIANSIDMGRFVELATWEERTGGRMKDSILGDAMEAILGAVYLDGGLPAATQVIHKLWGDRMTERAKHPGVKDYKTRLQEILARVGDRPDYEVQGSGPDHDRHFTATVMVGGVAAGFGEGRSKKEAEQEAARQAIRLMSAG